MPILTRTTHFTNKQPNLWHQPVLDKSVVSEEGLCGPERIMKHRAALKRVLPGAHGPFCHGRHDLFPRRLSERIPFRLSLLFCHRLRNIFPRRCFAIVAFVPWLPWHFVRAVLRRLPWHLSMPRPSKRGYWSSPVTTQKPAK